MLAKKTRLAILAYTMALAVEPAAAITYNVNDVAGGVSVTGSITTNGAIGILKPTDITDWNLLIYDPLDTRYFPLFSSPLSGSNSYISHFNVTNLTATANDLIWNYDSGCVSCGPFTIETFAGPLEVQWGVYGLFSQSQSLMLVDYKGEAISPRSGSVSIAEATTPLPAALPLFATGLGALGLLGWRRKRKQAA
jgi:hypothetical protein